jgi:hypothetical protein
MDTCVCVCVCVFCNIVCFQNIISKYIVIFRARHVSQVSTIIYNMLHRNQHLLECMEVSTFTFNPEMASTAIMIFIILLANIM